MIQKGPKRRRVRMAEVVKEIKKIANDVYSKIMKKKAPSLEMPIRSLQNVSYDSKNGYFELKGKIMSRTLAASTIKTFAQTLLMMNESKKIVETDDIATLSHISELEDGAKKARKIAQETLVEVKEKMGLNG